MRSSPLSCAPRPRSRSSSSVADSFQGLRRPLRRIDAASRSAMTPQEHARDTRLHDGNERMDEPLRRVLVAAERAAEELPVFVQARSEYLDGAVLVLHAVGQLRKRDAQRRARARLDREGLRLAAGE